MINDSIANPEDRFKKLFEAVQEAIIICDDAGHFTEINPAACTLFELSQEQLIDKTMADFAYYEDTATVRNIWQQLLKNGKIYNEYAIHLSYGRVKTVAYNAVANFIPGRHVLILHDVTILKRNEELLKASENQFRRLFEIMKCGVIQMDKEGNVIQMNPAAVQILGLTVME